MTDLLSLRRLCEVTFAGCALLAANTAWADPLGELAAFSSFKDVNLEKLASGPVKSSRGAPMSFSRGLAVESCYVVRKPLARTAELHVQWSPMKHPELKVYLHGDLSGKPTAADFAKLSSAPANGSVKAFAAATQKVASGGSELQMSQAEAKTFNGDGGTGMSPAVVHFWSNLLSGRAQAYLSGGLAKLPPYETGKETIRPAEEASRLLKEAGKIRGQFASLIEATPMGGGKGSLSPSAYWEMLDVEGEAAVTLGVLYSKSAPNSWQSVDAQYYASGGYYVLLTFQQMWPVSVGGKEATLVWRGDLISAASLATLHGVERMGSSTAMMRETQKTIAAFLSDIAKTP